MTRSSKKPTKPAQALTEQKKKKPIRQKLSKTQPVESVEEELDTVYLSDDSDATEKNLTLPQPPNQSTNRKFFTTHRHMKQPVTIVKGVPKIEVASRKIIKRSQSVTRDRIIVEPVLTHQKPQRRQVVTERKKNLNPSETIVHKVAGKRKVAATVVKSSKTANQAEKVRTEPVKKRVTTRANKQSLQRRLVLDDNDNSTVDKSSSTEDVYEFLPSQVTEMDELPKDNSYVQNLIEKFKKERQTKRNLKPKKKPLTAKNKEVIKSNLTSMKNLVTNVKDPPKLNKIEQGRENIRKRLSTNKSVDKVDGAPEAIPTVQIMAEVQETVTSFENVPKLNKIEQIMNKIRERLAAKEKNITNSEVTPVVENTNHFDNEPMDYQDTNDDHDSSFLPSPPDVSMISPEPRSVITNPVPSTSKAMDVDKTPKPNVTRRVITNPVPSTSTGISAPFRRIQIKEQTPNRTNLNPVGALSPWRIDHETSHLQYTKYFSFSNDLLPSYSSDVIVQDILPVVRSPEGGDQSEMNNSDMENIAPPELPQMKRIEKPAKRTPFQIIELHPTKSSSPAAKNTPTRPSPLTTDNRTRNRPDIQVLSNVTLPTRFQVVNNRIVQTLEPLNDFAGNVTTTSTAADQTKLDVSDCFGFDTSSDDEITPTKAVRPTDLHKKLQDLRKIALSRSAMSKDDDRNDDNTDADPVPDLFRSPAKSRDSLRRMLDRPKPKLPPPPPRVSPAYDSDSDSSSFGTPQKTTTTERQSVQTNLNATEPRVRLFAEPDELEFRREPEVS